MSYSINIFNIVFLLGHTSFDYQ